jgi:hypothetical protein
LIAPRSAPVAVNAVAAAQSAIPAVRIRGSATASASIDAA